MSSNAPVDLSELADKLTDEERQAAEDTGRRVTTAFLIVIDTNGQVFADTNLSAASDLVLLRQASLSDVEFGAGAVDQHTKAMKVAAMVQQGMMRSAHAAATQAQEAAIRSQLKL